MFKVDVITPVYNNQHFIRKCVESAHQLHEVERIIVINDGSTDGTLAVLRQLAPEFPKLVIMMHPGGVNRGIACSRNLGIQAASADWIAFLDSDDFYLPGRFEKTKKAILEHPDADGIYEPVVNKVLSESGALRFEKPDSLDEKIIAIKPGIQPEKVFEAMYSGKGGVVHLDGLTIRKKLAMDIGQFDENLRIVDDSVFRLKAAFKGKLFAGSFSPVAVRTIHATNSEPNIKPYDNYMKYVVLLQYLTAWNAPSKAQRSVVHRVLHHYLKYRDAKGTLKRFFVLTAYLISKPGLVMRYLSTRL